MFKYFLTIILLALTITSHSADLKDLERILNAEIIYDVFHSNSNIIKNDAYTLVKADLFATTDANHVIQKLYEEDCPKYLQAIADNWNKLSIIEKTKSYFNGSSYAHRYREGYFWYTRIMSEISRVTIDRKKSDYITLDVTFNATQVARDYAKADAPTSFLDRPSSIVLLFKILMHQRKLPEEKNCA